MVAGAGAPAAVAHGAVAPCAADADPQEPGGRPRGTGPGHQEPVGAVYRAPCGYSPSSRAISIRWTSLVPSPISRILESRHIRATGNSFMKP